ncbi:MAG: (2Fe-2S)-binding protein [Gammaproteobacteria bacterium]
MTIKLNINGTSRRLDAGPDTPLLYVLRNDLELNGPRFGCGLAQCGACSVLVDGVSTRSCVTPVSTVQGRRITTLEGLGNRAKPHPLQQAFIDEQAMQCGYCSNGMIISAAALLEKNPDPSRQDIIRVLAGHLCRCGTHSRIIRAVQRAAKLIKTGKA